MVTKYTTLGLACALLAAFQTILGDSTVLEATEADELVYAVLDEAENVDDDLWNYARLWIDVYVDVIENKLDNITAETRAERIIENLNKDIDEGFFN